MLVQRNWWFMNLCSIAVWPHVCCSVWDFNFLVSFFFILKCFFFNDGSLSPCNAHTCWSHFQPFHIFPSCRNYTRVVYTQIESLHSHNPRVRRAFWFFLICSTSSVEQLSFLFCNTKYLRKNAQLVVICLRRPFFGQVQIHSDQDKFVLSWHSCADRTAIHGVILGWFRMSAL